MNYKIKYIDLKKQHFTIKKLLNKEINKVFKDSSFILRDNVYSFEKAIAKKLRVKFCVGLNSGTDGLLMAMSQLNLKKNDEVIVPSHTYVASVSAIVHVGAKPIFVDIKNDYNIDPTDVEKKITKKTKAIMVVHLNGRCCDMDAIIKIAKKYKLKIIEDAAQCLGAMYKRRYAGTFGLASAFSLHPMKSLSVAGDGGFLTTNSKKIYKNVMLLRDHGRFNSKSGVKRLCYGLNSRLDNLQAGIALVKLKFFFKWIKKRREIANFYNIKLKKFEKKGLVIPSFNDKKQEYYDTFNSYVIRVKKREEFRNFLLNKGIEVYSHIDKGVHLEKNLYKEKIKLLNTEMIEKQIISLPIYPELSKIDQIYIVNTIKEYFEKK